MSLTPAISLEQSNLCQASLQEGFHFAGYLLKSIRLREATCQFRWSRASVHLLSLLPVPPTLPILCKIDYGGCQGLHYFGLRATVPVWFDNDTLQRSKRSGTIQSTGNYAGREGNDFYGGGGTCIFPAGGVTPSDEHLRGMSAFNMPASFNTIY